MVLATCFGFAGGLLGQATANHYAGSHYFPDCPATSPLDEDIGFAYEGGVVRGYLDGNYGPAGVVTRDQMATYTMRSFNASVVIAWLMVDYLYSNGYYFGADAYSAGRITYAQYVQNQKVLDWYSQLLNYQVAQGNTMRITDVDGAVVMRVMRDQLREMRPPTLPAHGPTGQGVGASTSDSGK